MKHESAESLMPRKLPGGTGGADEMKQDDRSPVYGTNANGTPYRLLIDELWMWHLSREYKKS